VKIFNKKGQTFGNPIQFQGKKLRGKLDAVILMAEIPNLFNG